jgi:hypothetical protein
MLRAIPELQTALAGCVEMIDSLEKMIGAHDAITRDRGDFEDTTEPHEADDESPYDRPDVLADLRKLFTEMSKTAGVVDSYPFFASLKRNFPQFGEVLMQVLSVDIEQNTELMGHEHFEQGDLRFRRSPTLSAPCLMVLIVFPDPEECYSKIVGNVLEDVRDPSGRKFVKAYMMPRVRSMYVFTNFLRPRRMFNVRVGIGSFRLTCDEAPEEPSTESKASTIKVECDVSTSGSFNSMERGIEQVGRKFRNVSVSLLTVIRTQSLNQKVTKHSPTLDWNATYTQRSRLERLPAYLTVQLVRFKGEGHEKEKILVREIHPASAHNVDFLSSGE